MLGDAGVDLVHVHIEQGFDGSTDLSLRRIHADDEFQPIELGPSLEGLLRTPWAKDDVEGTHALPPRVSMVCGCEDGQSTEVTAGCKVLR